MNDPKPVSRPQSGGPNLKLIYGIMLLAMVVAIVVAWFIVLPYYHRH